MSAVQCRRRRRRARGQPAAMARRRTGRAMAAIRRDDAEQAADQVARPRREKPAMKTGATGGGARKYGASDRLIELGPTRSRSRAAAATTIVASGIRNERWRSSCGSAAMSPRRSVGRKARPERADDAGVAARGRGADAAVAAVASRPRGGGAIVDAPGIGVDVLVLEELAGHRSGWRDSGGAPRRGWSSWRGPQCLQTAGNESATS